MLCYALNNQGKEIPNAGITLTNVSSCDTEGQYFILNCNNEDNNVKTDIIV